MSGKVSSVECVIVLGGGDPSDNRSVFTWIGTTLRSYHTRDEGGLSPADGTVCGSRTMAAGARPRRHNYWKLRSAGELITSSVEPSPDLQM